MLKKKKKKKNHYYFINLCDFRTCQQYINVIFSRDPVCVTSLFALERKCHSSVTKLRP